LESSVSVNFVHFSLFIHDKDRKKTNKQKRNRPNQELQTTHNCRKSITPKKIT
jgi:hypothetical protein